MGSRDAWAAQSTAGIKYEVAFIIIFYVSPKTALEKILVSGELQKIFGSQKKHAEILGKRRSYYSPLSCI